MLPILKPRQLCDSSERLRGIGNERPWMASGRSATFGKSLLVEIKATSALLWQPGADMMAGNGEDGLSITVYGPK